MRGQGWFDDLPEYLTEADYRDLSEEIARTIEIVHGHVIKCESPTPRHNRIARRLANALEDSRSPAGPCLTVETDVDVVLWRVPRFTYAVHGSVLELEQPIRLKLPISDLVSG
jgi:Uma2 family endonuclease